MIYTLVNSIKEYTWGSKSILPQLLGLENEAQKPLAELWMGTHLLAPSQVIIDNVLIPLGELIAREPQAVLGEKVVAHFGNELPFLFKILAIEKPLSVQVHPNPVQARAGFLRENALGIPLNAPFRNYKDPNQKQEIICAMTPLWVMLGFRPITEIIAELEPLAGPTLIPALAQFKQQPDAQGLKIFFTYLLKLGTEDKKTTNLLLRETLESPQLAAKTNYRHAWLVRLNQEYPADIGALLPLLMHVTELKPGKALFIPTGMLHTYLSGAGVELMTNSDNVMRGGLTPKHIDVDELISILDFTIYPLKIIQPEALGGGEEYYPTPSAEFRLSRIALRKNNIYRKKELHSPEILFLAAGQAKLSCKLFPHDLTIRQGDAVFVTAQACAYQLQGEGEFYLASVPI